MSDNKPSDDIIDVEPQIISDSAADLKPKRAKSRFGRWAAVGVLALACAVGGGWLYRDVLSAYLPSNQEQALTARFDELEAAAKENTKKVDAIFAVTEELKAKIGAAQAAADKSTKQAGAISAEQEVLISKLAEAQLAVDNMKVGFEDLKSRAEGTGALSAVTSASDTARMQKLEHDLAALQAAQPKVPDSNALNTALNQVKAKAAAGEEFSEQVKALAQLVPTADGLDGVQKEATQGLPSSAQLISTLNIIVDKLPKAAPAPAPAVTKSNGWFGDITSFFSDLVTVKELGPGLVADAAAKASAFAASGDLQQAADALSTVGDGLPADLKEWKDKALRRLRLDAALDRLSASVAKAGTKG